MDYQNRFANIPGGGARMNVGSFFPFNSQPRVFPRPQGMDPDPVNIRQFEPLSNIYKAQNSFPQPTQPTINGNMNIFNNPTNQIRPFLNPNQMNPRNTVRFQQPRMPDPRTHFMNTTHNPNFIDPRNCQGEKRDFRIFITIYDYDPLIMSPNPTGVEEELPFKEGQLVKIYGDCDEDGFYIGECNGMRGLIPSNMVTEIELDTRSERINRPADKNNIYNIRASENDKKNIRMDHGFDKSSNLGTSNTANKIPFASRTLDNTTAFNHEKKEWRKFVAMYEYDPHLLSPNVDVEAELAFKVGEEIIVHGDMDEDGFYFGQLKNGKKGLVPSNFLQEVFETAKVSNKI